MAKHYELTAATWFTDLEAALKNYYGDGAVIHKSASDGVVFSCPQISDKYMRIRMYGPVDGYEQYQLHLYVANEVNSDGTLKSAVTVAAPTNSNYSHNYKGVHVVLADKFLLMQNGSSNITYATSILVAKCSNGRCLFITGCGGTLAMDCMYSDKLTAEPIRFVSMATHANFKSSGKLVMLPSYFANDSEMELNEDGSFAYIEGLFCTAKYVTSEPITGGNYYISLAPIRGNSANGIYANSSLYVELEP